MPERIRFIRLYISAFTGKHKRELLMSGVVGFLSCLLVLQIYPIYVALFGKTHLKIGIIGRYTEDSLPLTIQNQISLGLTKLDTDGQALPSLAASWDLDTKGTTYTIHLLSNIICQDGKKFTASDVQYNIKGAIITKTDDSTVTVSLKEKFAPLPVLLSKPIIKPDLVGCGNYRVSKLTKTEDNITQLVLESQDSSMPLYTYIFYPTIDDAVLAFKRGEINILQGLDDASEFKNWSSVNVVEKTLYDRYIALFFNLQNQLVRDKEVRQALAYAIPTRQDLDHAYTPISPLSWAYSKKIRLYNYDPESAGKILVKSPISSASANLELTTFAQLLPIAQFVSDAWKKVGINAKIKVVSSVPSDFQILLATQIIPPDPDQYPFWQSTQDATNITNYSNPKIDKLLEDGRKTLELDARKKIYADVQLYLVDDAPAIFLYYPKTYTIERKK
jgi:peptide/nickel transport system substrate-binding protein